MNRKLLDFDGIILICPYITRHLANFLRTYCQTSTMQYQLLSRQMAHLIHLVIFTTVRTARLTSTTLLTQCMIVLYLVSAHVPTSLSQNIKRVFFLNSGGTKS